MHKTSTTTGPASQTKDAPALRLILPSAPAFALGLAADHLMSKPAFAKLAFGEWTRILVGQINRKQCRFVIDGSNQVQGFAGWALASRENAEAWISGQEPLSSRDSREGDCVVFNAWSAHHPEVHYFMTAEFRKLFAGKRYLYFRRHYKDGRTRSVRLRAGARNEANAAAMAA